jgi:hypothetical protein
MEGISFKANLIVEPAVYEKKLPNSDKCCPKEIFGIYKGYLEKPEIKKITEGDTIKITRCANTERDGSFKEGEKNRKKHGWGIIIELVSDKLKEPFVWEICYGENSVSTPTFADLKFATIGFLRQKTGIERHKHEKTGEFEKRILEEANKEPDK